MKWNFRWGKKNKQEMTPELTERGVNVYEHPNPIKGAEHLGERQCVVCGKWFRPAHYKQVTCSTECRMKRKREMQNEWQRKNYAIKKKVREIEKQEAAEKKSWKKERQCVYCGKTFMPTHPNQTLCSDECRRKRIIESKRAWQDAHTTESVKHGKVAYRDGKPYTPPIKTCPTCGKEFQCNNNHQKFCSIQCRDDRYKEAYKFTYVPVELGEKQCEICGKVFHPTMRTAKYCSRECYRKSGLIQKRAYEAEIYKQEKEEKDAIKEAQRRAREKSAKKAKTRDVIINKSIEAAPVVRKLVESGMSDDVVAKYLQTLFGGR